MAAQLPDTILINSQWMDLYTNPLETYWEKSRKKKPEFNSFDTCTRGYIASWAIQNDQLLLKEVEGDMFSPTLFFGKKLIKTSIKKLFPKSKQDGVLANWFSGKLRVPAGNMTQYEHFSYNSRFEKEIIITVDKGQVIKMVTLDYTQQKLIVNKE